MLAARTCEVGPRCNWHQLHGNSQKSTIRGSDHELNFSSVGATARPTFSDYAQYIATIYVIPHDMSY